MQRILHFPDSLNKSNGRMSIIMNIYRQLDRSKIQFDFVVPHNDMANYHQEITELGGRVHWYQGSVWNYLQVNRFLDKVLRKYPYQIIHYHATSIWGASLRSGHQHQITHRIMHSHNAQFSSTKIKGLRNQLFSTVMRRYATNYVACSQAAGRTVFGSSSFQVLNNVIDSRRYHFDIKKREKLRKLLGIGRETLLVGQVGRLDKSKNQQFTVKIIKNLLDQSIDVHLLLIGEGADLGVLKEQINMLGMNDAVTILGQRDDVNELYNALDLLCMPSLYEGLPMTGVEAQCAGLPVMFSDQVTEEVNLGLGSFWPLKDPRVWASQALQIVRQFTKADRGDGAEAVVAAEFDAQSGARKWQLMYEEMIRS